MPPWETYSTARLADLAAGMKRGMKRDMILGVIQESLMADMLSFTTDPNLSTEGWRYDSYNTPTWNALNSDIDSTWVQGKPLVFGKYRLARHIDIDVALQRDRRMGRAVEDQKKLLDVGTARVFNEQFIAGSQAAEPNSFDGMEVLIRSMDDAQRVYPAEGQLDLSTLSIDDSGKTSMLRFFDLIDDAIDRIDGHDPTAILMNRDMSLKFRSMARWAGLRGDNHDWIESGMGFKNTRDMGSTAATKPRFIYNGPGGPTPVYDLGINTADDAPVIRNDYLDPVANTSDNTHIWVIKLGKQHIEGLQTAEPTFKPIGLLEDRETVRVRFVWICGLAIWNQRSASLLGGIKIRN